MEPRIYKVVHLMLVDLNREVSVDDLAQLVNLSPSRLRHLFKEETGVSPAQYLKSHRLLKAQQLLETTLLSLKEIMHRAGFRDRSHFMRDFKKAYGLPPLQYRNQHLLAQQKKHSYSIAKTATR